MTPDEIQQVAADALTLLPGLLYEILPGGRMQGREYSCADLTGGAGDSCKVNSTTGRWADFATGEAGGDVVSLLAAVRRCSQSEAATELAERMGSAQPATTRKRPEPAQTWRPILPVPTEAPPPPETHPRHGAPSMQWEYRNQAGDLLGLVYRFDKPTGGKEVIPATFCSSGSRKEWRWQALSEPRPLYGLETLGESRHIVNVEGERAADAGGRLLGGKLPVVTWPGGSNAVAKADWQPLAGRSVAIWPDADAPGIKAALAVADELGRIGCSVKIVAPPEGVAKGWDLADAEAEGWTGQDVRQALRAALLVEDFRAKYSTEQPMPKEENKPESDTAAETPLLFDEINTPEIPASLLPGWLGEFAEAVARSTQTPEAMAVMLGLATVATCAAKRFEVSPYGEGYTEPLNLWTATALPPASRKTAVTSAMTGPLVEWEQAEAERLAPEIKRTAAKRRAMEKRRDKLEKDAANADDPDRRDELLREVVKIEEETPEEIRAPRLWTGDTTPERLQGLLADHGERMAVLSDEGGIFEIMAGLYSDGRANLDIFLQGHAGKSVRVDRQGRTAHLDAPALTFGLAIQPAILADMGTGGKRRFRGNGTLARFLYAVPRSNIGTRNVRANHPIPATVAARYRAGLLDLLATPQQIIDNRETPRRLALTAEALDSWQAFAQFIENRQGDGGDLEPIQDWSGKLPGAALRIAGNFHLVEYGGNPPAQIEQITMEKALDLCALLIDHAKAAFDLMDADPTTADAKAILKWIETERLTRFRRGEAYRQFKGRFTGKAERLDKAIKDLEARAIVTATTEPTAGRSATAFMVNPALWRES